MKLLVTLPSEKGRSYEIAFGKLGPKFVSALKKVGLPRARVAVITSEGVLRSGHAQVLLKALARSGYAEFVISIPNGEKYKSLKTLASLYSQALDQGLDRRSFVIALGGGVVTDLAGFFAATYMRGIPYVSIPTTILGMVDASIGGKTGVDLPEGKNLAGAFWQPRLVWIDQTVLKTLPAREWKTGFAEIIKCGVIKDRRFFEWLENKIHKNRRVQTWATNDVLHAIKTSAAIKAKVVSGDEREKPLGGGREILNFGHTIGHALEAGVSYSTLSHGEAISIGMAAVGFLSMGNGWTRGDQFRLLSILDAVGLPTVVGPSMRINTRRFWSALKADKKNIGGKFRFIVPKTIGRVEGKTGISSSEVEKVLKKMGFNT